MLSLLQVGVAALAGGLASLVALWAQARLDRAVHIARLDAVLIAVVVGVSILVYRAAANTPSLNDDPVVPILSPNDVLCPLVTYVWLGLLAGWRPSLRQADWAKTRGLLTLVALVVNVATI